MTSRLTILLTTALLLAGCATAPAPQAAAIPDLSRYHTVLVESVRVAPEAGLLSNANRQALERQLRLALVESLPADLRALAPAGDVLRVQVTVTALDGFEPIANGGTSTRVALPLDRGEIAFEVRYFQHGASIPFATVSERRKAGHFAFGSLSHYGHAVDALRDWGTGLAGSLPNT
jgi:uncharacterized lipoprotein YmbA